MKLVCYSVCLFKRIELIAVDIVASLWLGCLKGARLSLLIDGFLCQRIESIS